MSVSSISDQEFFVKGWKIPPYLEEGEVNCGVNSILTLVYNLPHDYKITLEEVREYFHQDGEGIKNEVNLFRRFNGKVLKKKGCFCSLNKRAFNNKKELQKQLIKTNLPVPVFFDMDIFEKVNPVLEKFQGISFNMNESHLTYNKHVMLLVGYAQGGEDLYFVDPNYILPNHDEETFKIFDKGIVLSEREFGQYTKNVDLYIEVRCPKKIRNQVKNDLKPYIRS